MSGDTAWLEGSINSSPLRTIPVAYVLGNFTSKLILEGELAGAIRRFETLASLSKHVAGTLPFEGSIPWIKVRARADDSNKRALKIFPTNSFVQIFPNFLLFFFFFTISSQE